MISKGSKLYSILFNKCPRCHEGDFMSEPNMMKLNKAFKMNEKCNCCGLKYMMEPSFFYGAMYVNYSLTVGVAFITFVIAVLGFDLTLLESFIPILIMLVLTAPLTIRWSRIIWINFFVNYDKEVKVDCKNE